MIEQYPLPFRLQEPGDPAITQIALAEVAELQADMLRQETDLGHEKAFDGLRYASSRSISESDYPVQCSMLGGLRGRPVVDLGCGPLGEFRSTLNRMRIGAYLGVDLYPGKVVRQLPSLQTPAGKAYILGQNPPAAVIEGDMLDVVSRLPDQSCSFVINGIDNMILEPYGEYRQALAREIGRTTMQRGVILGVAQYEGILAEFRNHLGYTTLARIMPDGQQFFCHTKRGIQTAAS